MQSTLSNGVTLDPDEKDDEVTFPLTIVAVGDLQRANIAEQIFMSRETNHEERQRVVGEIIEENPDLLLMLGDQVAEGASAAEWEYFDAVTKELKERAIKTMAVLGNHDYSPVDNERALSECYARWPETQERPSVRRVGPITIIGVDSNLDQMPSALVAAQAKRFGELLEELDADPSVRAVIVAAHHPPYSNSDLGGFANIEEMFAQPFRKAEKTRLFLSGHIHSYERFTDEQNGKHFVISGGGGGPRRLINVSDSRPNHNDEETTWMGSLRPFNYVRMTVNSDEVVVEAMMLQRRDFKVGDRFTIPLAPQVIAMPDTAAAPSGSSDAAEESTRGELPREGLMLPSSDVSEMLRVEQY